MSQSDFGELEPVSLDDHTEVKIPYVNNCVAPSVSDQNISLSVTPMNFNPNQCHLFNQTDNTGADLIEYNRILTLMRDLPTDMFIDQLLLDYHQSETNLDHFRIMLFEMLKNTEEFPFDVESELKRRVNTRQGETLASKLAKDIHTILSVIEGADASCLKDMISTGKRSARTASLSRTSQLIPVDTESQNRSEKCVCSAELHQLKELVATLQADMLLVKQRQAGTENLRNTEIKELKLSIDKLEKDVKQLTNDNTVNAQKCVADIESAVNTERLRCKGELLNNSNQLKTVQENMLQIKEAMSQVEIKISQLEPDDHRKILQPSMSPIPENITEQIIQENTSGGASQDESYSAVLCKNLTNDYPRETDDLFGNMKIPTLISAQRKPRRKNNYYSSNNTDVAGSINFKRINKELDAAKEKQQKIYNNYEYSSNAHYVDGYTNYDKEDADFDKYVRRRTRRFYLGGFRPNITEAKIAGYISRRGLKPTKISIFRNRGKFGKGVVIRANIQEDDNADSMTDDPYFWPEGVICRPWMSYGAYRNRRARYNKGEGEHSTEDLNSNTDRYRYDREQGHYDDNRYSVLDCDIDD